MSKTKYIFSIGELKRKDNSICFRDVRRKISYIPIENVREIYIMSEVSINTKLLDFLATNNVIVHFFNYYGNYSGTYYPRENYLSGNLKVKQVMKHLKEKEVIAKSIVRGIANNIHYTLYHYCRHGNIKVRERLDKIKSTVKYLDEDLSIEQILFVEGEIWRLYYESFRFIIPEEFDFYKRIRRPPDNPINALISFGNTLLYTKTISAIYRTHLDQTISFLHSPSNSRFSLSLDLSEVFKPIIVGKSIFSLVNNRRLRADKHFEKKLNYCLLNEEGKKIFLKEFEERMNTTIEHSKLKRKVKYETLIKYEGYKLIKYILEDEEFVPFDIMKKR